MHQDSDPRLQARAGGGVAELEQQVERLRAALAERDARLEAARERFEHDLMQARRELAQARAEQERLAEQLSASRGSTSVPGPGHAPQRRPRSWRARLLRRERGRQHDIQLLYASGLFDADWYLAEYPDVANTGADPAEHFLLHGGFEGRNPGPEFNTRQYLFDHPELVDGDENPLLHFIRTSKTTSP